MTPPSSGQASVDSNQLPSASLVSTVMRQVALTLEMVEQMIISDFSALGLQGNTKNLSETWLVDSSASNHMTSSTGVLDNVRKYNGSSSIQVANGTNLPVTAIGVISSSFKNVLVSPSLSTSLISVGQLVNNNYDV